MPSALYVVIVTGYFVSSAFVSAVFSVVAVVLSLWDVVDLLLQPINRGGRFIIIWKKSMMLWQRLVK